MSLYRCCPRVTFLPQARALFLSISHFSQDRVSPVTHQIITEMWAGDTAGPSSAPSTAHLGFPGPPEQGSLRKFKPFAKAALRDSRLCYKMTGTSHPHPDSQREAQKKSLRAETGTCCQDLHSILQPQALQ